MFVEYERAKVVTTIKELSNLKGRRALITGATGGLGRIMSDTLAELGADLVLVDQPNSDFDSLSANLTERWGVKVEYQVCDLEQQSQRSDLMVSMKRSDQRLNILINNAALVGTSDLQGWAVPYEQQTLET